MKTILIFALAALSVQAQSPDASGQRPMAMGPVIPAPAVLRIRAIEFATAWDRFVAHMAARQMDMTDYVHACEKAKVLFPALKGNCRDRKQLDGIFAPR